MATVTGYIKTQDDTLLAGKDAAGAATAAQNYAVQRGNHTGTQTADTITDGTTNKAYTAAEKTKLAGVATGATANRADSAVDTLLAAKADLVGGVIPSAQLPSIALTNAVTVASQAAMLALTTTQVQPGDVAVRTDGAGTFILTATDPTQLANWVRLNAPTDAVTSVNSQTGTVVLAKTDVGLGNVDNTSDANKPVSTAQQTALNLKAPLASPTFTGTVSGITAAMVGADTAGAATAAQAASLQKTSNLSDLANAATARTNLGLGTAATQAATAFAQVANLKAGTRRQAGRTSFPFTIASTPPTVSYPQDTGQAVITNYKTISLNPSTAPVTFLGAAGFTLSGSSYAPNSLSASVGTPNADGSQPNPRSALPFGMEFGFDGAVLVAQIVNKGPGSYRIRVNDQYVTSVTPVSVASDGAWHLLTLDFTSVGGAQTRTIKIELNNHEIIALRTAQTDTVWPIPPKGPRCIVLGDSYTGGAGVTGSGSTYPFYMAELLGWDDIWNSGIGGTGYITTSSNAYGGGPAFITRLPTDVTPYNPDVLIVAGGHNDASGSTLQTAVTTFFTAARAALPNARIIAIGPFGSGAQSPAEAATQANVVAGIAACAPGTVDQLVDPITVPWMTGTGYLGNLKNDGNSDKYIWSDGTHPTDLGHAYLGQRVAQAVQSGLYG